MFTVLSNTSALYPRVSKSYHCEYGKNGNGNKKNVQAQHRVSYDAGNGGKREHRGKNNTHSPDQPALFLLILISYGTLAVFVLFSHYPYRG